MDSLDRSNEVADFLESRSVEVSSKNKNPQYAKFVVVAYVTTSLFKELSYMEGIIKIEEHGSFTNESGGSDFQPLDLDEISGLTTWRLAGIDGEGIQVRIIDGGFQEIRNRENLGRLVTDSMGKGGNNPALFCCPSTSKPPTEKASSMATSDIYTYPTTVTAIAAIRARVPPGTRTGKPRRRNKPHSPSQ